MDARTIARDWLKALGTLVAGGQSAEEARAKVDAYAPLLAGEFRAETFCRSSLAEVARKCRFFPAYAELCEMLAEWAKSHPPPAAPALPAPAGWTSAASLTGMDREWWRYYRAREAENFGPPTADDRPSSRRRLLSLIRRQSPAAYEAITGEPAEPAQREPTEAEKRAVAAALVGRHGREAA